MRIPAFLPIILCAAALPAQTPSLAPTPAPVPAAQPDHAWTLQERSTWSSAQAPRIPLAATEWPIDPDTSLALEEPKDACPVNMQVRRLTSAHSLLRTRDGHNIVHARLRMSLHAPDTAQSARKMLRATVTVHGTNGRKHILGVEQDRDYELTRTFTVSLNPGDSAEHTAELLLPGFTSTAWVELKELVWDNGKVWSIPNRSCRVQPDPLMLITER